MARKFIPAKSTKCKHCGSECVAWVQSKKGRWLLAETYVLDGSEVVVMNTLTNLFKLHKCK